TRRSSDLWKRSSRDNSRPQPPEKWPKHWRSSTGELWSGNGRRSGHGRRSMRRIPTLVDQSTLLRPLILIQTLPSTSATLEPTQLLMPTPDFTGCADSTRSIRWDSTTLVRHCTPWLNQHGFITKGTHPVAWCPNDKNPVGVVDIQGGVEPEIGDSHLVKFESDRTTYPTSTLRPETIFGVTNIWVNPNTRYVKAQI